MHCEAKKITREGSRLRQYRQIKNNEETEGYTPIFQNQTVKSRCKAVGCSDTAVCTMKTDKQSAFKHEFVQLKYTIQGQWVPLLELVGSVKAKLAHSHHRFCYCAIILSAMKNTWVYAPPSFRQLLSPAIKRLNHSPAFIPLLHYIAAIKIPLEHYIYMHLRLIYSSILWSNCQIVRICYIFLILLSHCIAVCPALSWVTLHCLLSCSALSRR